MYKRKQITVYLLECDKCGRIFGSELPYLFRKKDKNISLYSEWQIVDDKYYCPKCYKEIKTNN